MKTFVKFPTKLKVAWIFLSVVIGSQAVASEFRIGLVLDKGGKDDKSFNAAAYQGAVKAKDELNAYMKYVEATDDNAFEQLIRSFAQKNFDLIVAIGVAQAEAVKKVSVQFPKQRFAIVDAEVNAPNVRSLVFEEHQGSFLVGAIAAQVSKTGIVGFIGGMDIPLIRRFEVGFAAGAKKINPNIKILANYVGVTADAWNNPAKAKELAVSQYNGGADVVFSASGASGAGIFDAAEEKKKFAIGVDSNQNWVKPGFILTSMVKHVDTAVYEACKDAKSGKFSPGTHRFNLNNQGVGYSIDQYNDKLISPSIRKKTEELKEEIIAGKIKVPDFYKERK